MVIRLGCLFFSSEIIEPWNGFLTLEEITNQPLSTNSYLHRNLNRATALHQAIIDSLKRTDVLAKMMQGRNSKPYRKIIILSDGSNNCYPQKPTPVLAAIEQFDLRKNDMISMVFLKTAQGLSKRGFELRARKLGITDTFIYNLTGKKTESQTTRFNKFYRRYFTS